MAWAEEELVEHTQMVHLEHVAVAELRVERQMQTVKVERPVEPKERPADLVEVGAEAKTEAEAKDSTERRPVEQLERRLVGQQLERAPFLPMVDLHVLPRVREQDIGHQLDVALGF